MGETEIVSTAVGEEVMRELSQLDQVAYVRFASVYREFKDIDQFMDEIKSPGPAAPGALSLPLFLTFRTGPFGLGGMGTGTGRPPLRPA